LPKKTLGNRQINQFFDKKLELLNAEVQSFESLLNKKTITTSQLKEGFKKTRLAYKQLAVLSEYFNPYESKLLNGPAIKRVEEDNPQIIIHPHGFQVLEEMIFNNKPDLKMIRQELEYIREIIKKLQIESDRVLKFTNEKVWQALRMSIVRLTTLGITGFDSPIAQYSFEEAKSSLISIRELISIYENALNKNSFSGLDESINIAIKYLNKKQDFNAFDRLGYITQYLNPVYSLIQTIRIENGWLNTAERLPLNETSKSIFEEAAFNINFFSPNERYRVTPERVALGEKLFYDPVLSSTKTQSCNSCHRPELAFIDGLPKARSIDEKTLLLRNTPTLINSVFQTRQFYDSRALTLETQLSDVVHNSDEMGGSLQQSVDDLKAIDTYKKMFKEAYPSENDPVSQYNIANAISSYVRSRVALNSRFDQYMRGTVDALNDDEKQGFNLFAGKGKCASCHFIPLTNGLVPPDFNETESEVLGVPANNKKRATLDADEGKYKHTNAIVHKHAFKTPTLRNITLTAPYMHNGVFKTLEEVIDFYDKGGGAGLGIAPDNQTLPAEKLKLSNKEKKQIIAFLKSLTDTSVISIK